MCQSLFKTKWGNTEILVHAFLLGGYVSFPDDEEVKEKEGEPEKEENKEVKDEDILPPDSPERFKNKNLGKKRLLYQPAFL